MCAQEYKFYSKMGLPHITPGTIFKIIGMAITLAVLLFGLIKALMSGSDMFGAAFGARS